MGFLDQLTAEFDRRRIADSVSNTVQPFIGGAQQQQAQPQPGGFFGQLLGLLGGQQPPVALQQAGGLPPLSAPSQQPATPFSVPAAAPMPFVAPQAAPIMSSPAPAPTSRSVGGYMPRSAAMTAFGPQPDNVPSGVPMYGRSSADALPTFAALQGAPTSRVTPDNASGLFSGVEQKFGLPAGYLSQTAQIESGGNPNALNKGSGAAGLFQFVPSTARQYGLSNPNDVVASTFAAGQLASDNANVLRNALGRDPTAGELYLAHQQGAAGVAKLLSNPDVPAATIVGAKAVQSNGGTAEMTAGQFASQWTSKFGAPGGVGPAPAPGQPSPSVGPYGALDPNALGGGQLPTMAAMGAGLSPATPFAAAPGVPVTPPAPLPLARSGGTSDSGGYVARDSRGKAVRTDADGNALGADGQPTSLAYGGVPTGANAAPASRAISNAAPIDDPLVTVPATRGSGTGPASPRRRTELMCLRMAS